MSVTPIKDSFKKQGQKRHPSEVQEVAHPQRPGEIQLPIKNSVFFQK